MKSGWNPLILILCIGFTIYSSDYSFNNYRFSDWLKGIPDSPYRISWGLDLSLATTNLTLQALSSFYKPNFTAYAPEDLNNFDKSELNALDQLAVGPCNYVTDKWSDASNILLANSMWIMLMGKRSRRDFAKIIVMYAQLYTMTPLISQWIQPTINRKRPYFYCDQEKLDMRLSNHAQTSLPSSHANFAFSFATLTSLVFRSYYPDSPWRHVVWPLCIGLATTTSALRVASHVHYPTDVMAGAATGTLMGFFIHAIHKNRDTEQKKLTIEPIMGNSVGFRLSYSIPKKDKNRFNALMSSSIRQRSLQSHSANLAVQNTLF